MEHAGGCLWQPGPANANHGNNPTIIRDQALPATVSPGSTAFPPSPGLLEDVCGAGARDAETPLSQAGSMSPLAPAPSTALALPARTHAGAEPAAARWARGALHQPRAVGLCTSTALVCSSCCQHTHSSTGGVALLRARWPPLGPQPGRFSPARTLLVSSLRRCRRSNSASHRLPSLVFVPTPCLSACSLLHLHIMHIHERCG